MKKSRGRTCLDCEHHEVADACALVGEGDSRGPGHVDGDRGRVSADGRCLAARALDYTEKKVGGRRDGLQC